MLVSFHPGIQIGRYESDFNDLFQLVENPVSPANFFLNFGPRAECSPYLHFGGLFDPVDLSVHAGCMRATDDVLKPYFPDGVQETLPAIRIAGQDIAGAGHAVDVADTALPDFYAINDDGRVRYIQ